MSDIAEKVSILSKKANGLRSAACGQRSAAQSNNSLMAAYRMPHAAHRTPHTACRIPHTACRTPHAARRMPLISEPESHPHIQCSLFPIKVLRGPSLITRDIAAAEMHPRIKIINNLVRCLQAKDSAVPFD